MNPGQRILPLLLPVCLYTINCKWFLFWNSINKCTAKSSASIYRSPVGSLLWSHWARKLTLSFSSLNWHLGPPTASPDSLTARQRVTAWKGSLSIRGFDCVASGIIVWLNQLLFQKHYWPFQIPFHSFKWMHFFFPAHGDSGFFSHFPQWGWTFDPSFHPAFIADLGNTKKRGEKRNASS